MPNEIIYWTTKNGTKINVDDMSHEHLKNTLKMIIKNHNKNIIKQKEFKLNGDMAEEFNQSCIEELETEFL